MAIPEQFIDELVARSDIADVVSSYVRLTPKGSNLWGLCPFHSEKTPSFSVSPDKQIYYCFGCHKGGGVISFLMEMENLSFHDAVRLLAQRAGVEVPETGVDEAGNLYFDGTVYPWKLADDFTEDPRWGYPKWKVLLGKLTGKGRG